MSALHELKIDTRQSKHPKKGRGYNARTLPSTSTKIPCYGALLPVDGWSQKPEYDTFISERNILIHVANKVGRPIP